MVVLTKMVNAHSDSRPLPVQQVAGEEALPSTDGVAKKMDDNSRMPVFESELDYQIPNRKYRLAESEHVPLHQVLHTAEPVDALPVSTMMGPNAPSIHPTEQRTQTPYDVGQLVLDPHSGRKVFLRHDAMPVADTYRQTSGEMSKYKLAAQGQGLYSATPLRQETEALTNYENQTNYPTYTRAITTINEDVRAAVDKTLDGYLPDDTQLREERDATMVGYEYSARLHPTPTMTARDHYAETTYQGGGVGAPHVFSGAKNVDNIQKQALETRGAAEADHVRLPVDKYASVNPSLKNNVTYLRAGGETGTTGGRVDTSHSLGSRDALRALPGLASGAAGATLRSTSTAPDRDTSRANTAWAGTQQGTESTAERTGQRVGASDAALAREAATVGIDGASTAAEAHRAAGATDAVALRGSSAVGTTETERESQAFDTLMTETTVSTRSSSGTGAAGSREASATRKPLTSDAKNAYTGLTAGTAGSRVTAAATRDAKQEAAFRTHSSGRQSDFATGRADQSTLRSDARSLRTSYGAIRAVGPGALPGVNRGPNLTEPPRAPLRAELAPEPLILPVPSVA